MENKINYISVTNNVRWCMPQCVDCEPDYCDGMLCIYGRAYDDNGCVSCDCLYPCEASN
jgi:hypothetical protein